MSVFDLNIDLKIKQERPVGERDITHYSITRPYPALWLESKSPGAFLPVGGHRSQLFDDWWNLLQEMIYLIFGIGP